MTAIAIRDLEMCKSMDRKALAKVWGGDGVNNVGYETNNRPAMGVISTQTRYRTAILGVFTVAGGQHKRMVQDINLEVREVSGGVRFEPLAY